MLYYTVFVFQNLLKGEAALKILTYSNNPSTALIVTSPALIVPLLANKFPNNLAAKVSNNIPRDSPFCSFPSFLIVSLTPYFYARELVIFHNIIHFFIRTY